LVVIVPIAGRSRFHYSSRTKFPHSHMSLSRFPLRDLAELSKD
jgi:hypothetical protein